MKLTIFYDGLCPLCVKEMRALKARDQDNKLCMEDIWQADFTQRFPAIDVSAAGRVLHAVDNKGELWLGLDVTARAWSLVGVRRYNCLRWPLIKPIADFCYRRFANNRYGFSRLLTGRARLCAGEACIRERSQ